MKPLTQDELIDVLKLQFHMVAGTLAELAQLRGENATIKLSSRLNGCKVSAVLMADRVEAE